MLYVKTAVRRTRQHEATLARELQPVVDRIDAVQHMRADERVSVMPYSTGQCIDVLAFGSIRGNRGQPT